ncbi:cytochrome P450 [Coniophora puteana RWD-64-598 SS2]|uniref:Cytochrome P450 n=1 Tax=Coniophora puteana (strain RWD-64-598) TaxID=741705 RepID=A0A5M3N834_CONPW|nr:cytochrome P450 [Coniophora puteana RWD-64-598 SS2]EIW87317.1 cytochrome P450 [Coniophora puteana RWD-64-598 SS2]
MAFSSSSGSRVLQAANVPSAMLVLASAVIAAYGVYVSKKRKLPQPPGPPGKWLIGNLKDVPRSEPWRVFAEWAKIYGPIFMLRVPNKRIVVLNTFKAVTDLLESRASIYSDRPTLWMYTELAQRRLVAFSIPYTHPHFRSYRRLMTSSMRPRAITAYQELQKEQSRVLLRGLAAEPGKFVKHLQRQSAAVILDLAYGWKVTGDDDYFVRTLDEGLSAGSKLQQPGQWLVEYLPWLRFIPSWFPGATFRRVAEDARIRLLELDKITYQWAKNAIDTGKYSPSFCSDHLLPEDGREVTPDLEQIVRYCSAGLYVGGADTTVAATTAFFLAMALFPEVQARAQAELDAIAGTEKLPDFEARDRTEYVNALVLELIRWAPVVPLGLSHRVMQDDVYEGYLIPEGSTVTANIWAIAHDPTLYPSPFTFDPTRFLGPAPQQDPRKIVFGFGRRVCPGQHFAEQAIYLTVANVLAAFSIAPPLDKDGREVKLVYEAANAGIVTHPKAFECRIVPRNRELIPSVSE